jgi:hypothetical protein
LDGEDLVAGAHWDEVEIVVAWDFELDTEVMSVENLSSRIVAEEETWVGIILALEGTQMEIADTDCTAQKQDTLPQAQTVVAGVAAAMVVFAN